MLLQEVLLPQYILVDLEANEKDDAFKEMVTFYCKSDKNASYDDILNAVRLREAKMSTGIHKGIAIPHGKTNAVNKLRGVVGISKKGVNYDALDGEPVYLLFMIISPLEDSENYLRLLKHLAELIDIPKFQSELQSQEDSESVYNILRKYEDMLLGKN